MIATCRFWFSLITFCFFAHCSQTVPRGSVSDERLTELEELLKELQVAQLPFSYILVEGRVKCSGCEQYWMQEFERNPEFLSKTLLIHGEPASHSLVELKFSSIIETSYTDIETNIPYLANFFLFTVQSSKIAGCVELGSSNMNQGLLPFLSSMQDEL